MSTCNICCEKFSAAGTHRKKVSCLFCDFEACRACVQTYCQSTAAAKDPKTELQEWLQARRWQLPMYRVVGTTGAAHQQTFDVECEVPELKQSQRGIGSSRRSGEQAAALAMLQWLRENPQ